MYKILAFKTVENLNNLEVRVGDADSQADHHSTACICVIGVGHVLLSYALWVASLELGDQRLSKVVLKYFKGTA